MLGDVFLTALRLGLTSFGGPIAHLGYFRRTYVDQKRWLDDARFAEIVALCNFLPGPTSSQVGLTVGLMRAGIPGAFLAWLGFTAPSAIALALFALLVPAVGEPWWVHGLLVAAVAVVADAVLGMAQRLTPDLPRIALALVCAAIAFVAPGTPGQLGAIALGAALGLAFARGTPAAVEPFPPGLVSTRVAIGCAVTAVALFIGLPALAALTHDLRLAVAATFFRAGSLVFGGGHVVLPLLQAQVVTTGWVAPERFLAGYGAAQAVPGPLFTFAAYLGALMPPPAGGWSGALIATLAIFAPSFLLVFALVPFWSRVRANPRWSAALVGVNAAVVGLLAAAFVHPVLTSGILSWRDVLLAALAFVALRFGKVPAWAVVGASALAGFVL